MSRSQPPPEPARIVGRYALFHELASGGMATVHLGRLQGSAGFSRTVAVKRLHPQHAKDPEFVAMLLDEARLAARIHHPNVVPTLDVVAQDDELFLVMDYVHGESLARLLRLTITAKRLVPVPVAVSIILGMLHGLHAAHEAKSETGEALDIVHRDMSPQNVIVGADGVARVLDFGVAKAANRVQTTGDGQIKGKLRYMSPEQLRGREVTRSSDIFSAAIVAWELLTCQRFVKSDEPGAVIAQLLADETARPSTRRADLDWVADEVVLRGLARDPNARYRTALEFAVAFEKMSVASVAEVSAWVKEAAAKELAERGRKLQEMESLTPSTYPAALSSRPKLVDPVTHQDTRVDGRSSSVPHLSDAAVARSAPQMQMQIVDESPTQVVSAHSQHPSQLSSISVTASVATPPMRRSRQGLVIGLLFALLGIATVFLGIVVLRTRKPHPPAALPPPTLASAVAPPPEPASAEPSVADATPPTSVAATATPSAPPRAGVVRTPRRNPPAHAPTNVEPDIRLQR